MKIELSGQFPKNAQIHNFMKIRQWESSYSLRTDGQKDRRTDMKKANSRFSQFCEGT